MIGRSLGARLLVALVAAQVSAILLAMILFTMLAPYVSAGVIADATFRGKIKQSIGREASGRLALRPSAALEAYRRRRPGAAFAVLSLPKGELLKGSDPALGARLAAIKTVAPLPGDNFETALPGGGTMIVNTEETPNGAILTATTGNAFGPDDGPGVMTVFMPAILPLYGPVIFGALVLIPLIVGMVTRPLRRLAGEAALISPGSLERRLDESGLGVELQALARAVNAALARIEDGMARQRLYAANAAHELRTPIAILGLHVDQLEVSTLRARLQSDVARIQTLVEQLVTVARLGQTHVAMDEQIDLVGLLRDVVADRAPIAIRDQRRIELQAGVATFVVGGNRQALFSAFANLVDNAIRAEPCGGTVSVALDDAGTVTVSDHGPGVRDADRDHVFEPFWRGAAPSPGAGLGLAIVKEIADRHDVPVDVVETVGGGATFRMAFAKTPRFCRPLSA